MERGSFILLLKVLYLFYPWYMATVREELIEVRSRLAGIYDSREREAVVLLIFRYVKGWSRVDLIMEEGKELSDFAKKEIDGIVDRLILGEPIQYITGEARFYGMDFKVGPGVLIPRPETEELIDWVRDDAGDTADLSVLDIGTGSGCIAIALARHLVFPKVMALDFSEEALMQAKENAKELKANVNFIKADMYDWMPQRETIDIIVSNPPYIAPDEKDDIEVRVKDFEPAEALFVEADDPLKPYKRIEQIAKTGLRPAGKVYMELNPRFADEVRAYFLSKGWSSVELRLDSYGKKRMLKCIM